MENTKKKMLIYKIILILLLISALILGGIIYKKQVDDKSYHNENMEITQLFHDVEKELDEAGGKKEIQLEYKGHKVIGLIRIPVIDLEYPIIDKTTKETLTISISRFCGGEINEYGNVSLAGHNNYSGTMFGKNKRLKNGDKVYLTDLKGNEIEYEIYDIFVTDPNDATILQTNDESIREVTLITCKNGHSERLIAKAKESIK